MAKSALACTDNDWTIFNNIFSSFVPAPWEFDPEDDDDIEQADDAEDERNGACLDMDDRDEDDEERGGGAVFPNDDDERFLATWAPPNDSQAELLRKAFNTMVEYFESFGNERRLAKDDLNSKQAGRFFVRQS